MAPNVSVIIPAHNASDTISASIESVIAQTFPNWEAIVVNDGSTDGTREIIDDLAKRDPRISPTERSQGGEAAARNTGLAQARHEWLLFLDADDWIHPSYMSRMMEKLTEDPRLDAVHCGSARVAPDGSLIVERFRPPEGDLFEVLAQRSAFPVHACIVRKSIVQAVGGFDSSLIKSPDWDLWQRVARTGALFGSVPEVLAFYRMRPDSASMDAFQMFRDGLRVLKQGHAPDPRVKQPHPDHASGLPPEGMRAQQFYLLCWCAGVLLGSNRDPFSLLDMISENGFADLYPDAVAKCIFDSVLLPSCETPEKWESAAVKMLGRIDEFLVALETKSGTAMLAVQSGVQLRKMILHNSVDWRSVIEEYERNIALQKTSLEEAWRDTSRLEAEKQFIIQEKIAQLAEKDRLLEQRDSEITQKNLAILQVDSELKDLRLRAAGLASERDGWQKLAQDRKQKMKLLRRTLWVRLGARFRFLKLP